MFPSPRWVGALQERGGRGQGAFLGLVFGPRKAVELIQGVKSPADSPVSVIISGEKKVAGGLGIAIQGEVAPDGKATVNGGVVVGYGGVTKPLGVKVASWDPLKPKETK